MAFCVLVACSAFSAGFDGSAPAAGSIDPAGEPLSPTATTYLARVDLRRCARPLCGGYFVSAVNQATTRCADGSVARECYVADLDLSKLRVGVASQRLLRDAIGPSASQTRAVLFGDIVAGGYGKLLVRGAWIAPEAAPITGAFYRIWFNGTVCVAAPCPSYNAELQNLGKVQAIHDVDVKDAPGTEQDHMLTGNALFSRYGLIVAGQLETVPNAGPAGPGVTARASQYFLPITFRR
jgi:hypothetical protein